jgi:hypothetical protein
MQGLTRDEVEDIQTYTLGDTFTPEEKEHLLPRMTAFNSAVVRSLLECHALSMAKKIGVQPSTSGMGNGLFCGKQMGAGGNAGVYIGTLEVKTRYKGRGDYAISLPTLEISKGKFLKIILCGFSQRETPLNAVMINHTCLVSKLNVIFEMVRVTLYADLEARAKRVKMQARYEVVPEHLTRSADEELFAYYIVVAKVVKKVASGAELLVSYNGSGPNDTADDKGGKHDYFMSREQAERVCKRNQMPSPCMCEPTGCPMDRVFLVHRDSA